MNDANLDIIETYTNPAGELGYRLVLIPDGDLSDPTEDDGWKVYSFSRKHISYQDPDGLEGEVPDLPEKLASGLAFPLSYFEHGNCLWMLADNADTLESQGVFGADWQWDGVSFAGVLVWEGDPDDLGPKTLEDRKKDAAGFVKIYTAWCNGEGYGYRIEQRVFVKQDRDIQAPDGSSRHEGSRHYEWEPVEDEECYGYYGYDDVKGEADAAWHAFLESKGLAGPKTETDTTEN